MQTMNYKTSHFIQYSGNVVDLEEYRRRLAAVQQDSLAREPEQLEQSVCQLTILPAPQEERRARRSRRAWVLDVCASLSVIVMTLLFALRVML